MEWYLTVLKKYTEFEGRARRSEYWYFFLFNLLISIVLAVVDALFFGLESFGIFGSIYSVAVLLPSLAVAVRRLHDTGRSGWNLLWAFLPIIGTIIIIVYLAQDSQPGTNKWGSNPKEAGSDLMDHLV